MARFGDAEPLARGHRLEGFDCGVASLDAWLTLHSRGAAGVGWARTFVGAWLLDDALRRSAAAGQEIGARAVLAIDDSARAFYTRFGLEPSPTDPLNLQITIKDIHAALGRS